MGNTAEMRPATSSYLVRPPSTIHGISPAGITIPRGEFGPGETQYRWSDRLRSHRSDLRSVMAFVFDLCLICFVILFSPHRAVRALQVCQGQVVEKSHPGSPYGDSEFPIGKSLWHHPAQISQAMVQFPILITQQSVNNNSTILYIPYHIK